MQVKEQALVFDCQGEQLIGIIHQGESEIRIGVLIVVGGPQYRVGSHRQFLLLARALALHGTPVMRFDVRGMGDSGGEQRFFDQLDDDIRAAVDCNLTILFYGDYVMQRLQQSFMLIKMIESKAWCY